MASEPANAVHQAAKEGEISVLSTASKKQLNSADKDGWTAVHWCAWAGDPGPLEIVLDRGGNPNKPDVKGCSPLHVAATYGNFEAIELLMEYKSDIFALDNMGMHAAKSAAVNRRLECYRLLESLHNQLRISNPDFVKHQQTKAIKTLEKRLQKGEKVASATSVGKTVENGHEKVHRFRLGSRKKTKSTSEESPFVLKNPNKEDSEHEEEEEGGDEEDDDDGDDTFGPLFPSKSTTNTLRPLPKITSGAILNTLVGVTATQHTNRLSDDSSSTFSEPISGSHNRRSRQRGTDSRNMIGTIEPINPTEYEIENDSPLVTFLHSVDAYETGGVLLQEKMDMTSLMLCSEEDLKGIGIALGPRKRIMDGISKRASVINKTQSTISNEMIDTDL